jgi:hypothetical protein
VIAMTHSMILALQITLVGTGLVFASIGGLWLLMALLARFTADQRTQPAPSVMSSTEGAVRRRKAALAAVSVALARERTSTTRAFPLPPTATVSAWQAVMRAAQLRRRGSIR